MRQVVADELLVKRLGVPGDDEGQAHLAPLLVWHGDDRAVDDAVAGRTIKSRVNKGVGIAEDRSTEPTYAVRLGSRGERPLAPSEFQPSGPRRSSSVR